MRASVHGFGWARLWPALENLSGRKPRELGGVYEERVLSFAPVAAKDALLLRLQAAVLAFRERVCVRFNPCSCRIAGFMQSAGSLSTREFVRCG
jgi:hypothetical protein